MISNKAEIIKILKDTGSCELTSEEGTVGYITLDNTGIHIKMIKNTVDYLYEDCMTPEEVWENFELWCDRWMVIKERK